MAEKRSITAREAKDNLEAFGYEGPARWSSIDAFVKANPRAKAAVTANEGALVQKPNRLSEEELEFLEKELNAYFDRVDNLEKFIYRTI